MSVRPLKPQDRLDVRRGAVVICIPVYGASDLFAACLRSVLDHTPADVPILVADDADPDPASRRWLDQLEAAGHVAHDVWWMRQPENLGFVGNVNTAFAACAPADVVLLNSDCEVAEGWLAGLRAAADSDSLIATATALTNHGTIVSVPHRNLPQPQLPKTITFTTAAARVRERSARLRPRIPTAVGHCVLVRRAALELVGAFDEAFAPAYGEEVDFSQRCVLRGLQHVVADDVLVLHKGGASLDVDGERNPAQEAHERLLAARYPYYHRVIEDTAKDRASPLARSLALARRAMLPPRVTIDGRCLTPFITGTQVHTLEVIHALWRTGQVHIRVITPADTGLYARELLDEMNEVELHPASAVSKLTPKDDVVHRPFQVTNRDDLNFLAMCGDRVVVTHHDLIAYRNPGYFAGHRDFVGYRQLTQDALNISDVVVFVSEHAAADAFADDLVEAERSKVVLNGIDHQLASLLPEPVAPAEASRLAQRPFLLCLGTDFRHKNRLFALQLFAALRAQEGWDGLLVFAGPRVAYGSSSGEEAAWLALHPDVAADVVELPAVDEAEKAWLYRETAAVVYPTVYEGFGLVPFEAADAGKPCLWAPQASLAEVLPVDAALIVPWDAVASAARCVSVLRDKDARERHVELVRAAGRELTWQSTAQGLLEAYELAARLPARTASRLVTESRAAVAKRGEWEGRYWHLRNQIGPTGMALVGPDAWLPEEAQRGLAGLARRRATRGPLLAALKAVYRMGGPRGAAPAPESQAPPLTSSTPPAPSDAAESPAESASNGASSDAAFDDRVATPVDRAVNPDDRAAT